jgi:hypothetical protein
VLPERPLRSGLRVYVEPDARWPVAPVAGCSLATKSWSLRARVYADGGPAGSSAGGVPGPEVGVGVTA